MAKYAKPRGAKLAIVIVIATLVVVWLVAFGGAAYIAGLFQPAQTMPAGTFAIGGQNVMVTGGTTTVVEGANRATVYGSNAGLSGVTSVSFRLTVRDTNPGTVAKGFTMTITAGTYQSAGGGNFPLVTYKGSSTCYDMSLGTASGGSMALSCNTIDGSTQGSVAATLTSAINGSLWGVGAPPAGTTVAIVFHIDGQTDYQLAFTTSG